MTHSRGQKQFARSPYLIILCVFILMGVLAACTPKLGPSFIEDIAHGIVSSADNTGKPSVINYFFDKTLSMRGFATPSESEYTRVIDSLWTLGIKSWGSDVSNTFYRYGTLISKLPFNDMQKSNAKKSDFYSEDHHPIYDRDRVKQGNSSQVFGTVVEYIKDMDKSENALNIVITDLYEQNAGDNYFNQLFQNAFERGQSATLFAVKSAFDGSIYEIHSGNRTESIRVRNAYSTFFIFIVGNSRAVTKYSKELGKEFDDKNIEYENSLFIIESPATQLSNYMWTPKPKVNTGNERTFNSDMNKYAMVNIRPYPLRTWKDGKAIPLEANAYRIVTNIGSRYIGGIPVFNVDPTEFDYKFDTTTIEYYDGKEKSSRGKFSTYVATNKPFENYFTAKVIPENSETQELKRERQKEIGEESGTDYIYLIVETKNGQMDRGYYKVRYTIKPIAKIPAWVEERSASTIGALKESNISGGLIRVMNLKSIYRDIDNAFNNVNGRAIYSDVFYLVKPE